MIGSADERPLAGGEETGKAAGDEGVQKEGASADLLTAEWTIRFLMEAALLLLSAEL